MKSSINKKIAIFITMGIVFTLSISTVIICSANSFDKTLYNENIKSSAVSGKIHIIGYSGWSDAKTAGICTGNGTYSEPYVIEDLVIDGEGSGDCISIQNSDVFFKIENCTTFNSGSGYSGIKLRLVRNGLLLNNIASIDNRYGIYLGRYCNDNVISGNELNNNYYGIYLYLGDDNNTISKNIANYNDNYGIYLQGSDSNTLSENNASYNLHSGIYLSNSEDNFLLGNTINDNNLNGVYLIGSRNNNIEGNFIKHNDIGIRVEYSRFKEYIIEINYIESFYSNQISNNIFNGNIQDIRIITHFFDSPFEFSISVLLIVLSIATVGIVAISLTGELITKQKYPRGDEKYHLPIYGISALVVESIGALIFILGAMFLIPITSMLFWLFMLVPFAIAGIIISRKGLSRDSRKGLAKLGLVFGIPLLILGSLLIMIFIAIVIAVIVVIFFIAQ